MKDKTGGGLSAIEPDKTKQPIEDAVWEKARPAMHQAANVSLQAFKPFKYPQKLL